MKWTFTLSFLLFLGLANLNAQTYEMDGSPINDCSGFFTDSGGPDNPYSSNESLVTTICPDFSSGTHIQLNFSGIDIPAGDLICFYDGTTTADPLLSCNSDFLPGTPFIIQATAVNPGGCITVEFVSDGSGEGDGWNAVIDCVPACQIITSVLETSTPLVEPVDTGYIDICPGDIILLEGMGLYPQDGAVYNHSDLTSSFEWEFGDGTFGIGPLASHQYNEPGGYTIQLTITDQFGCTNTNFISQRVRVSPSPSFENGGFVPDPLCAGDTLQLFAVTNFLDSTYNISVTPGVGSFDVEGARSDSLPLPDGTGVAYTTGIDFTEFSPGQVLTNINDLENICVNIEHSWMRDLEISIQCPNGTQVVLHNHPGPIGGEVFLGEPFEADEGLDPPIPGVGYDYCWTPNATAGTWIDYANANFPATLPEGDYNSFEPMSDLLGCPLNGEWQISVEDLWGIDNGFIFSWSIEFNQDLYPDAETFSPTFVDFGWENNPTIIDYAADTILASPQNAGNGIYTYFVEDEFGCFWDTTISVNVLPETHPDCYMCSDILQPEADTSVCETESVQLDVGVDVSAEAPITFEAFPLYEFGQSNHPPPAPFNSIININSINPTTITNPFADIVSVCIDIETDFLSDVAVFLQAPDGSIMELTSGNGGGSDFYTQTCFTPVAATPITAGASPFTGDFQPEGSWNDLNGAPINGDWRLLVSDSFGPTAFGTLNSWSITFQSTNEVIYSWSPTGGLDCFICPDPLATPAMTSTYVVTAQDVHDCVALDTVTIEVLDAYEAPMIDCTQNSNGEITFTWNMVNGVTDYLVNVDDMGWEPANAGLSHIVSGLTNGQMVSIQVQVDVVGSLCAIDIGSQTCTYTFCNIISNVLILNDPSCANDCDGSATIEATGGNGAITYTITQLDGQYTYDQNNGLFNDLCDGDHMVVMEDATGCLDTLFFELLDPPGMSVDVVVSQPISCFGEADGQVTAIVGGGAGNYSYLWDDPLMQILPTASFLNAGSIGVVVTDDNGCTASAGLTLTQPDALELDAVFSDVACFGDNTGEAAVTVVGGSWPYSFSWNDPAMSVDSAIGGLIADPYQVVVTDANGCTENLDLTITEPATAVTATAAQVGVSCFGENTSTALAEAMGGTGPAYTYSWSNTQQTDLATGLPPGAYSVTISDANDCEAIANVNVVQYDSMELLVIFAPPTCNGTEDGSLAVTDVDGGSNSGILDYFWSADPTINGDVISGLPGNQTYSVTVTDDEGCSVSEDVFMPEPEAIEFNVEVEDILCFGDTSGTASVNNIQNTVGDITYIWSPNSGSQITQTAIDLAAGTYSVTLTDDNGCTATATTDIDQPTAITSDFFVEDNSCFGFDEGTVSADPAGGIPGYTFEWSTGDTGGKVEELPNGWYFLTITDANGCELADSVEVESPAPILPSYIIEDVTCYGYRDGLILAEPSGGEPPFQYSLDGEFYSGSNALIGLEAGTYNVFILDANGCDWLSEVQVSEPDSLELTVVQAPEITIELGEEIELFAYSDNNIGPTTYTWFPPYAGTLSCTDCFNPIVTTQNTITYEVMVVDSAGCVDTEFVTVRVSKDRVVLVPTGFSPNGDGENDLLHVHGREGTIVNSFQVFDRWGELLYQQNGFLVNDLTKGWDGSFRGEEMNSGVFIWYLEVTYIDGVTESFKGSTTLIR